MSVCVAYHLSGRLIVTCNITVPIGQVRIRDCVETGTGDGSSVVGSIATSVPDGPQLLLVLSRGGLQLECKASLLFLEVQELFAEPLRLLLEAALAAQTRVQLVIQKKSHLR